MGFGRTEDYKKTNKKQKKKLSPDLSESLTRFTISMNLKKERRAGRPIVANVGQGH